MTSSYRQISNLSYLSKLIETTIEKQLWAHLKDVNVIPGNQSAYRENYSTETSVCSIMNDMIQMVSEGKLLKIFNISLLQRGEI